MNMQYGYISSIKTEFATRANKFRHMANILPLEYRLLAIIPTLCAKPMSWYTKLLGVFGSIYESSRYNLLKFVLGLGLFPLFKLNHLLYEFLFLVNDRKMFLLERQCVDLKSKQMFKNIRLGLCDCLSIVRGLQ